jgi:hypothetical protein
MAEPGMGCDKEGFIFTLSRIAFCPVKTGWSTSCRIQLRGSAMLRNLLVVASAERKYAGGWLRFGASPTNLKSPTRHPVTKKQKKLARESVFYLTKTPAGLLGI